MSSFFNEVKILIEEGMLHKKLVIRIQILFIISFIMLGVVSYNIIFKQVDFVIALLLSIIGFLLGRYVFSRMDVVNWNEEQAVLEAGKMDRIGYITLGIYIIFEIGFRTFLQDYSPVSATAFVLALVFGTLLGRAVGTVVTLHQVFVSTHTK